MRRASLALAAWLLGIALSASPAAAWSHRSFGRFEPHRAPMHQGPPFRSRPFVFRHFGPRYRYVPGWRFGYGPGYLFSPYPNSFYGPAYPYSFFGSYYGSYGDLYGSPYLGAPYLFDGRLGDSRDSGEPPATRASDGSWYYCRALREYYPDVKRCPEPWLEVPPTPPER